ncbi:MAG: translation elongation factor Ts [Oscillospiraceae bacterium]|jgi:elongation factor Ts|nr:translation elongation factor Ts [Oscillospiraceae bacterium]
MGITAEDVKALREKTGCGIMDCKEALVEANGDANIAVDILRKKGLDASLKKSSRVTVDGVAMAITNEDQTVGVCIEVNSETDFVAKNTQFLDFVNICAKTVIDLKPESVEELLNCKACGTSKEIGKLLEEKILIIGENIRIRRFERFEGVVSSYIHIDGRVASLVKFDAVPDVVSFSEFKNFSKDVAMQIAAAKPLFLNEESIPSDVIEHERKVLFEQIASEGKPENIIKKIVDGRMNKFFKENCLLNQEFIKDSSFSVSSYLQKVEKELNIQISIEDFVRYEKGEKLD